MNNVLLQQFIQLISTNTGLYIREQDGEALSKKIYARMKFLNLSAPEKYYQILKAEGEKSSSLLVTLHEREWKDLTLLLTTGESYFFRDKGQLTLLKNRILPELINHKKKARYAEGEAKPSLCIWSAGCSTGEEAYSLAILVKELIPDWNTKWKLLILGTDINPESIEKAKQGIYYSWSFRMVEPDLQKRYFYRRQTGWELDEQIRKMVTFRSKNLINEHFTSPTSNIHNFDIILCRNVFIYFDYKSISLVLQKFYNALSPGGYLITGHAELHGQNLGQLQTKVFPESVVYQRSEVQVEIPCGRPFSSPPPPVPAPLPPPIFTSRAPTSPSPSTSPLTKENQIDTTSEILNQAETLFHNGAYASAIKDAERVINQQPDHFGAYYLMAQAFANLGECDQAIRCCQQALKVDYLSVKPYYLLAHIAEEQRDIEKAKNYFKKIIYLAPSSIAAYLELGSLYEREDDTNRAKKMRDAAFELLKELPPHVLVEHQGRMTAAELIFQLKKY